MALLLASWAAARAWPRDSRGQSFVEIAAVAPLLVFVLIAGVDMMRVNAIQVAIQNGARVGAEVAALDRLLPPATVRTYITNDISRTPGLNPATVVACSPAGSAPAAGAAACADLPPQVNGRYEGILAGGGSCTQTLAGNVCYIRVTVRYTFQTIVPWPLVSNVITVSRTVSMPIL